MESSSSSRSLSPTRNVYHPSAFSISLRRSSSPTRAAVGAPYVPSAASQVRTGTRAGARAAKKRTCACSPTTHPGSFRCSLHRNGHGQESPAAVSSASSAWSGALNMRRSAMVNSIVRIGSVEGEWVKRALTTLIRPSSHHMRRRAAFQPRPSRLRHMTCACR